MKETEHNQKKSQTGSVVSFPGGNRSPRRESDDNPIQKLWEELQEESLELNVEISEAGSKHERFDVDNILSKMDQLEENLNKLQFYMDEIEVFLPSK